MQAGRDFLHVIQTRFNLATPGRESQLRVQPGWLAERFELFERYCLPTLAAQSCQDFRWIVYFDEGTPAPIRARIDACRRVRGFHPYFTALFPGEHWPVSVRETVGQGTPWLLTTRLDNDDGLAVDYVARLHAAVAAAPPRRAAFNFTEGYVFDGRRIYAHAHPSNAFASLMEPWDAGARTVSSLQHMALAEHGAIVQIAGPGAWLQVVHGGNVSNKIRGRRVPPREVQGRFPEAVGLGRGDGGGPGLAIAAENLLMAPLRGGRDMAAGLARRLRRRG